MFHGLGRLKTEMLPHGNIAKVRVGEPKSLFPNGNSRSDIGVGPVLLAGSVKKTTVL